MEADVLHRHDKFPPWRHFRILAPRRQKNVDGEDDEIGRQNAQGTSRKEASEFDALIAHERREELAADQITAEDKEKIDTDPAEAIDPAGQFESEKRGVVNDDHDDGERAEKIETRLALAILKARTDYGFSHSQSRKKAPSPQVVSRLRPAALDRYLAAAPAMSRFQPLHSLPSKGEEDDERWAGSTTDES